MIDKNLSNACSICGHVWSDKNNKYNSSYVQDKLEN